VIIIVVFDLGIETVKVYLLLSNSWDWKTLLGTSDTIVKMCFSHEYTLLCIG